MIIFDLESGPQPEPILRQKFDATYTPPEPPGAFDPATVKYGNTKAADKRAIILAKAEAAHAELLANFDKMLADHKELKWQELLDGAALDPLTGRVLAIGMKSEGMLQETPHIEEYDDIEGKPEEGLLEYFWHYADKHQSQSLVGLNIFNFDIPFLVKRSWILGVTVPDWVRNGRYWSNRFVDLMVEWHFSQPNKYISADALAAAFGIDGKSGEVTGANFHEYYWGGAEKQKLALAYLENDLRLEWEIAERMQF